MKRLDESAEDPGAPVLLSDFPRTPLILAAGMWFAGAVAYPLLPATLAIRSGAGAAATVRAGAKGLLPVFALPATEVCLYALLVMLVMVQQHGRGFRDSMPVYNLLTNAACGYCAYLYAVELAAWTVPGVDVATLAIAGAVVDAAALTVAWLALRSRTRAT